MGVRWVHEKEAKLGTNWVEMMVVVKDVMLAASMVVLMAERTVDEMAGEMAEWLDQ